MDIQVALLKALHVEWQSSRMVKQPLVEFLASKFA
jgi:hypothetical protein